MLLVIVSTRFKTIHDVFAAEKKVCFHESLYDIMEREYPANVKSFRNSSAIDLERLFNLQRNDECDSIVISRYSLSFISTQIESCDSLYPLYDEDLFAQEVIVAISQTLGELGDELINVMDEMASKNLYREKHDSYVSNLTKACEFQALNDRNGVAWESFFSPFVFSLVLSGIAFTIGCIKYKNQRKSMQSESNSPQCIAESEEELASLLDSDDDLNKFSFEVKRIHEESEERIMKRIIENVESNIMKRITVDSERAINQIAFDNECVMKRINDDNECTIKRITDDVIKRINDDNESVRKRVTDIEYAMKGVTVSIERISRHTTQNE